MITNQIMKRPLANFKVEQRTKDGMFNVTGKHESRLRNDYGTEEKQKEYFELEKQVAMLISERFLKTPEEVVNYLRKKFILGAL